MLCYVMLLSILSKDRVVQKDKPVGVLPTKSTYKTYAVNILSF